MGIAPHCERLKIAHHDFMKAVKKKAQLLCMSASAMCITVYEGPKHVHSLSMSLSKIRTTIYAIHKIMCFRCARLSSVQHGFMKPLKMSESFFLNAAFYALSYTDKVQ